MRQVCPSVRGVSTRGGHDLLAVADRDGVDRRMVEPLGIARRVVPAEDDESSRHLAPHELGKSEGATALGGEVALQADDVRVEGAALGETALLAVDAQVVDAAGMAGLFEAAGHADEAQRLDEGEHLQAQNPADRRLQEGDSHGRAILSSSFAASQQTPAPKSSPALSAARPATPGQRTRATAG